MHGGQQLSLFHAHHGERCFLPIHVYEAGSGKPVAVILRPGKTPDGAEVMLVLRHIVAAIRRRWPRVDILVRGDSHEAMSWCERNRIAYVFGLAGNKILLRRVAGLTEEAAVRRAEGEGTKVRRHGEFRYAARTWHAERRVIGRIEASERGGQPVHRHQPARHAALAVRGGLLRPRYGGYLPSIMRLKSQFGDGGE